VSRKGVCYEPRYEYPEGSSRGQLLPCRNGIVDNDSLYLSWLGIPNFIGIAHIGNLVSYNRSECQVVNANESRESIGWNYPSLDDSCQITSIVLNPHG